MPYQQINNDGLRNEDPCKPIGEFASKFMKTALDVAKSETQKGATMQERIAAAIIVLLGSGATQEEARSIAIQACESIVQASQELSEEIQRHGSHGEGYKETIKSTPGGIGAGGGGIGAARDVENKP